MIETPTATATVGQYARCEWRYPHQPSGNPFEVNIEANFAHEDGLRQHVDGFYDGEATYAVRFMPARVGRWRYTVFIEGVQIDAGRFECTPSDARGPLMQDAQHPYHFVFADGTPFYLMGNTAYRAAIAYRHARDKFREFLDYYAARRFNWLRFSLSGGVPQHVNEEGQEAQWVWGGTPTEPDFSVFDLERLRDVEGVIHELAQRGMIASCILLSDRAFKHGLDERVRVGKRLIREAVARYGAFANVVWNVANEWNKHAIYTYADIDELGGYLRQIDPYRRLIAVHHYARFEFFEKNWTDMSSLQHRGLPGEINRVIQQNRMFNKPVLNEEYGYEGDNIRPPNDAENVRRDHWAIALAGGYGTYGDKTKGPKIGVYFSALLEDMRGTVVPDMLRHLHAFMETTGYRTMSPANVYLSECNPDEVFCLAQPGREYIVYLTRGQPFTINLAHVRGSVSVTWYNPRTGDYTAAGDVAVAQTMDALPEWVRGDRTWLNMHLRQNVKFTPPDVENDWVLHLKYNGD